MADGPVEVAPETDHGPVAVCSLSELTTAGRRLVRVRGRTVALFCRNSQIYALDDHCYHNGGPLNVGDIEDVAGHSCVVCPWHKYKISLQTGEAFYQAINPNQLHKPAQWRSKGIKQRVHHVTVEGDTVFVQLSDTSSKIESDFYYSEAYNKIMHGSSS